MRMAAAAPPRGAAPPPPPRPPPPPMQPAAPPAEDRRLPTALPCRLRLRVALPAHALAGQPHRGVLRITAGATLAPRHVTLATSSTKPPRRAHAARQAPPRPVRALDVPAPPAGHRRRLSAHPRSLHRRRQDSRARVARRHAPAIVGCTSHTSSLVGAWSASRSYSRASRRLIPRGSPPRSGDRRQQLVHTPGPSSHLRAALREHLLQSRRRPARHALPRRLGRALRTAIPRLVREPHRPALHAGHDITGRDIKRRQRDIRSPA